MSRAVTKQAVSTPIWRNDEGQMPAFIGLPEDSVGARTFAGTGDRRRGVRLDRFLPGNAVFSSDVLLARRMPP